ncbi:WDR1 protein, partial [Polypterus senegalus]
MGMEAQGKRKQGRPKRRWMDKVKEELDLQGGKVFASLPQVERGVSKVLGGDPKGNNFLYTNGKCVIIRNIDNPAIADIYTEHAHQVTVAKYAPSGFYIASGDISGKLRIWDTTQKEHILKYEYQPFAGRIKDMAWTEDSKRIAAVGEGRENPHLEPVPVIQYIRHNVPPDIKSEPDMAMQYVTKRMEKVGAISRHGNHSDHTRFVNSVKFSPDGNRIATAGADGQIFIYDGKTGEKISSLGGDKAHSGGIYAVGWSPDSTQLLSASGDKTAKLWDLASTSLVTTFNMGSDVLDQQLGCLWQKNNLLTVSLSGNINYLDKNNPDRPLRIIKLVLLKDKRKVFVIDQLEFEPSCADIHLGGVTVAVGGSDGKIHLYSIQGNTLTYDGKALSAEGPVTDLAFSHNGAYLAACDASKIVKVFTVADGYALCCIDNISSVVSSYSNQSCRVELPTCEGILKSFSYMLLGVVFGGVGLGMAECSWFGDTLCSSQFSMKCSVALMYNLQVLLDHITVVSAE